AWLVSGSVVLPFSGVTAIPEEWSAPRGQVVGLAIPTSGFGVKHDGCGEEKGPQPRLNSC
ncbi:hypothetical protein THAOC_06052, partial [Thalassiosira oceanica]